MPSEDECADLGKSLNVTNNPLKYENNKYYQFMEGQLSQFGTATTTDTVNISEREPSSIQKALRLVMRITAVCYS